MKTRNGFVSNSSSASFAVKRADISDADVVKLIDALGETRDGWTISNWNEEIRGSTIMDNGELSEALQRLGVDTTKFKWYDQYDEYDDDGEVEGDEFDTAVNADLAPMKEEEGKWHP